MHQGSMVIGLCSGQFNTSAFLFSNLGWREATLVDTVRDRRRSRYKRQWLPSLTDKQPQGSQPHHQCCTDARHHPHHDSPHHKMILQRETKKKKNHKNTCHINFFNCSFHRMTVASRNAPTASSHDWLFASC